MKIVEELTPISVTNPAPGTYVFDFGQNFVGWPQLELAVPVPAGTLRMTPAESLASDGSGVVDQSSFALGNRGLDLFNSYTAAGDGPTGAPQGLIRSEWANEGDRFDLTVEIPANTSATVWVPVTESELQPPPRARFLRSEDSYAVYRVGSGVYTFASAGLAPSE